MITQERRGIYESISEEDIEALSEVISNVRNAAEVSETDLYRFRNSIYYFTSEASNIVGDDRWEIAAKRRLLAEKSAITDEELTSVLRQLREVVDKDVKSESDGWPRIARVLKSIQSGPAAFAEEVLHKSDTSVTVVQILEQLSDHVFGFNTTLTDFNKSLIEHLKISNAYSEKTYKRLVDLSLRAVELAQHYGYTNDQAREALGVLASNGANLEKVLLELDGVVKGHTDWEDLLSLSRIIPMSLSELAGHRAQLEMQTGASGKEINSLLLDLFNNVSDSGVLFSSVTNSMLDSANTFNQYGYSMENSIESLKRHMFATGNAKSGLEAFNASLKVSPKEGFDYGMIVRSYLGKTQDAISKRAVLKKEVDEQLKKERKKLNEGAKDNKITFQLDSLSKAIENIDKGIDLDISTHLINEYLENTIPGKLRKSDKYAEFADAFSGGRGYVESRIREDFNLDSRLVNYNSKLSVDLNKGGYIKDKGSGEFMALEEYSKFLGLAQETTLDKLSNKLDLYMLSGTMSWFSKAMQGLHKSIVMMGASALKDLSLGASVISKYVSSTLFTKDPFLKTLSDHQKTLAALDTSNGTDTKKKMKKPVSKISTPDVKAPKTTDSNKVSNISTPKISNEKLAVNKDVNYNIDSRAPKSNNDDSLSIALDSFNKKMKENINKKPIIVNKDIKVQNKVERVIETSEASV